MGQYKSEITGPYDHYPLIQQACLYSALPVYPKFLLDIWADDTGSLTSPIQKIYARWMSKNLWITEFMSNIKWNVCPRHPEVTLSS